MRKSLFDRLRRIALALVLAMVGLAPARAETWTASYQFPPGDPRDEAMRAIAHQVARAGLDIRLFPSASLLRPNDQWDALVRGSIDMAFIPADYLLDRFPMFAALSLPGAIRSQSHAERVGASQVMRDIRQQLEAAGVMVLTDSWIPGTFATKGKCVVSPVDARGLRARTIGRYMSEFWGAAGATPVPTPNSESLPILVSSNLIDIANTSVTTLLSLRMEKSFACLTVPGEDGALWYLWEPVLVSKKRFDALDEPRQQDLLAAAGRARQGLTSAISLATRRLAGSYIAVGTEVVVLDGSNLAAWHKLAKRTVWKSFRDQVPGGGDILDRLQAMEP